MQARAVAKRLASPAIAALVLERGTRSFSLNAMVGANPESRISHVGVFLPVPVPMMLLAGCHGSTCAVIPIRSAQISACSGWLK